MTTTTTQLEAQGRALGDQYAQHAAQAETSLAAAHAWARARLADGWSLYEVAKILDIAATALKRRADREGWAYQLHPRGGAGRPRRRPPR